MKDVKPFSKDEIKAWKILLIMFIGSTVFLLAFKLIFPF